MSLIEALRNLANAADDVGVRYFDTDTADPLVAALIKATEDARAAIASAPDEIERLRSALRKFADDQDDCVSPGMKAFAVEALRASLADGSGA